MTRRSLATIGALFFLVLISVAPAAPEEALPVEQSFDLQLEKAFGADGVDLGLGTPPLEPWEEVVVGVEWLEPAEAADLRLTPRRDFLVAPVVHQSSAASATAPKKKGFGRWLKKHWYVPVLVGVAVGAVAFGGDDDDANEIDDD